MDALSSKVRVYRAPVGIRVQTLPGEVNSKYTTKSKCYILSCGDTQIPISESEIKNSFQTSDGKRPDPSEFKFGRIYEIKPIVPLDRLLA